MFTNFKFTISIARRPTLCAIAKTAVSRLDKLEYFIAESVIATTSCVENTGISFFLCDGRAVNEGLKSMQSIQPSRYSHRFFSALSTRSMLPLCCGATNSRKSLIDLSVIVFNEECPFVSRYLKNLRVIPTKLWIPLGVRIFLLSSQNLNSSVMFS